MSIIKKVRAVEKLFASLDKEQKQLKAKSGISCFSGCGKCCHNPEIYATPLEFLPLAYSYFLVGRAEEMLETLKENRSPVCQLLSLYVQGQSGGLCGDYQQRGLVCRLFGYSAQRDKHGKLHLLTCKEIKTQLSEEFLETNKRINEDWKAPVASEYYQKLKNIDIVLSDTSLPINEAIAKAIEEVMHYYAYRPMPVVRKNTRKAS